MKKTLTFLILISFLSSCTQKEEIIIPEEKSETQKYTV
jgi:lipoprotein